MELNKEILLDIAEKIKDECNDIEEEFQTNNCEFNQGQRLAAYKILLSINDILVPDGFTLKDIGIDIDLEKYERL